MTDKKGMFEPQEGFALPSKQSTQGESGFALPKKKPDPESEKATADENDSPFRYVPPKKDEPGDSGFGSASDELAPSVSPFRKVVDSRGGGFAESGLAKDEMSEAVREEDEATSIKQLELRAIFGVDRELTQDELLERSRGLAGVRHVSLVAPEDVQVVENMKRLIGKLGFPDRGVKFVAGNGPIEFIREGSVIIAVQTEGGFAPGVRETLIIVARELGRA